MSEEFKDIHTDPEAEREFADAQAVLAALHDADDPYKMGLEFMVTFLRGIRSGFPVSEAIWHAQCEWDL